MDVQYKLLDELDQKQRNALKALAEQYVNETGYLLMPEQLFRAGPFETIAALHEGEPVGFIHYNYDTRSDGGRLNHGYVRPESRKQGISKQLYKSAVDDLATAGPTQIFTQPLSIEAKGLIRGMGFELRRIPVKHTEGFATYGVLEEGAVPKPKGVLGRSLEERRKHWEKYKRP